MKTLESERSGFNSEREKWQKNVKEVEEEKNKALATVEELNKEIDDLRSKYFYNIK